MTAPASANAAPLRLSGAAACALAGAGMLLVLLLPALWNGFPLIFPDTGGYLMRPLSGTLELGRSALYGLFLVAGAPLAFWPNVLLQAALIAWLIALTLRVHQLGGVWRALGVIAILCAITSLPWFAGQLMPDILFPAAVLALYLLAFANGALNTIERIALALVIALAVPSHMAMLALALGFIVAIGLAARLRLIEAKPRLRLAALAVAAGVVLGPVSNLLITGQFAFTPGGVSFFFGRLVEDGIISRYLDRQCPDPSLRICPYRKDITRDYDDWLWKNDTPFWKLGGWKSYADEERRIILATLASDPLAHLSTAFEHSAEQLFTFDTEISVDLEDNAHTIDTFRDFYPHWVHPLMAARQQAEPFDLTWLNLVHVPVAGVSLVALLAAFIFRRRLSLPPQAAALTATVLLVLVINAAVCGIFSHAADRYQSRLVWLAPFALIILLGSRKGERP